VSRENRKRVARPIAERSVDALARVMLLAFAGLVTAGSASASEGDLVLTPELPMLLALIALFVILIFPVNALLFRPIFAALDAREDKIAGTRVRAEKLSAQAEEVLRRYQGSVRETREATEHERRGRLLGAKNEASERLGSARGEAEREIEQARGEIRSALVAARSSLRGEAEALAREASARILGRNLS
jgi:F-type H+-transporting ATPase subunit b